MVLLVADSFDIVALTGLSLSSSTLIQKGSVAVENLSRHKPGSFVHIFMFHNAYLPCEC